MISGVSEKVGIVGLGTMGAPIAARLVGGGFEVYGCDLQPERLRELESAGGNPVERPDELPGDCSTFLLLLPNPGITNDAVLGERGLIEVLGEGDIVVNLGTIGPDAVLDLDAGLGLEGVRVLDAPMGKSSREAAEGTLALMVAGERTVFEECRPIFERIASDVTFCGEELGVASTIKLVNNLVAAAIIEATAEGLALGTRAGAPLGLMVEVLSNSGADSYHLRNTFGGKVAQRNFEPGFSVDLATKDLKIGLDMAAVRRIPSPVLGQTFQRFLEAQSAELGLEDWGALAKLSERASGTELK